MKELPKVYEPQQVEGRIYRMWMDNDCFHADPNPDKKPFSIVELRARVAAHLRREQREKHHCLSIQGIRFLLASREVAAGGVTLPFTRTEYEITLLLAKNRGQTFSREQIYEAVLGYDKTGDASAITEHIKNIRKKFAAVNMAPIQTVWGIGYRWNA